MNTPETIVNYSTAPKKPFRALIYFQATTPQVDAWKSPFAIVGGVTTKTVIQDSPLEVVSEHLMTTSNVELELPSHNDQRFTTLIRPQEAVDIAYATSATSDGDPELALAYKLARFEEVAGLFMDRSTKLIRAKVFLDIDSYDYDLMRKIIEQVEIPTQNKLGLDQLISFDYVYGGAESYLDHIGPSEKCLFRRASISG